MDENMMKYIYNDILVTCLVGEKIKADKVHKQVKKLTSCFAIFAFVTANFIVALTSIAAEQNTKIEKLTEVIKELTSAKGE